MTVQKAKNITDEEIIQIVRKQLDERITGIERRLKKIQSCKHEWDFKDAEKYLKGDNITLYKEICDGKPCVKCGLLYKARNKKPEDLLSNYNINITAE